MLAGAERVEPEDGWKYLTRTIIESFKIKPVSRSR